MDPTIVLIVGGGLALLLLVVGIMLSFVGGGSVVEERLGRYAETGGMVTTVSDDAADREDQPTPLSDFLNNLGEGTDLFANISTNLAQADIKLRPAEYLAARVIVMFGVGVVAFVLSGLIFAVIGAIVGFFIPPIYVGRAKKGRLKAFDSQLGDMLNLVVNGLRAGFSTLQALEAVSHEMPTPISDEFRRVVQEMQLGIPMEEALEHLMRRIHSDDLDLVITAINVQREVGGNLAEILDVISFTIRERVRIKGEISALTAQGRATAWVISALPIALIALLFLVNRPYIMQFFNPETRSCGIPLVVLAGLMVISGFTITQKIVDIDI
ncbi:MAG: type II secretion system F family protein [Anaerolineae bacterium]|nr:MAG: type II secretion system F family protein [Anaerolineae bacterium]